jgi:hypothetical protein
VLPSPYSVVPPLLQKDAAAKDLDSLGGGCGGRCGIDYPFPKTKESSHISRSGKTKQSKYDSTIRYFKISSREKSLRKLGGKQMFVSMNLIVFGKCLKKYLL